MKQGLVLLLALCTLASAMVPRDRRAVDTEEQSTTHKPSESVKICASRTPCQWSIYHPYTKIKDMDIVNSYCICDEGLICTQTEDDTATSALVFYCRAEEVGHS